MIRLRYYQVFDHSKTFIFKSMLPFSNSSCKDQGKKKKTKHKLHQDTSNTMTYFGDIINLPLPRTSPSAHLRMLNTESLAYRSPYQDLPFIIKCLSSMFKNMGEPEEKTFATVSNKQYRSIMMHKKFDKTDQEKCVFLK